MNPAPPPAGYRYPGRRRSRPPWRTVVGAAGLVMVLTFGVSGSAARSDPISPERGPEVVVREYLRILQAGDARAARGYAAAAHGLVGASDDLLVPQAMGTGWTLTRLARRHHLLEDQAIVDVEITAAGGGTARQGRFELERRPDGRWTILNPLVRVDFSLLPVRFVEVNGVSTPARKVWLFPGTYHTYGSIRDLLQIRAPTYVVAPGIRTPVPEAGGTPPSGPVAQDHYLPHVQLTDTGQARLHEQLRGRIDECAATGDPFPTGCPFAAGDRQDNTLYIGTDEFHADEVSWQVTTYPRVKLTQTRGVFAGRVMVPGQLQVSGTGTSLYGDGRQAFQGPCTIWLPELQVNLTPPRKLTVQIDESRNELSCDATQYYH